ncbi:MAG: hypothetical protein ACRDTA_30140 [Pseudonocardiaceae bacterium]
MPGAFQGGDQSDVFVRRQRGKPVNGTVGAGRTPEVRAVHVGVPSHEQVPPPETLDRGAWVLAPVGNADHAGHRVDTATGVGQLVDQPFLRHP